MKKFLLCLLIVCVSSSVFAHAPSNITFVTNDSSVVLLIDHKTLNPGKHFIYLVTLSLNGKKLVSQEFIRQEDANQQKAVFNIPGLKKDDKIEATASCNMGGDLTMSSVVK